MARAYKIFGAALDVLDDDERIALKQAYLNAKHEGLIADEPKDPYDILAPLVAGEQHILSGKLNIPGHFTPRPELCDRDFVKKKIYTEFIDNGDIIHYIKECGMFVAEKILPHISVMLGVDHAMSAGPIRALSAVHGPENLCCIIFDRHFDAITPQERGSSLIRTSENSLYNCGSFLLPLITGRYILPENLIIIGAGDSPDRGAEGIYAAAYNGLINRGVRIIPNTHNKNSIAAAINNVLPEISAGYIYISLDADVGSFYSMNAVRFLDGPGMGKEIILECADVIRRHILQGRFILAGLDICEIDVHLLDLQPPDLHDATVEICAEFLGIFTG